MEGGGAVVAVGDDENLLLQLAFIDVDAVVGYELLHGAVGNEAAVGLAPLQEAAHVAVHVVLIGRAALGGEATLGEGSPYVAVGLLGGAAHENLSAVVYLRYTGQGKQNGEGLLQRLQHGVGLLGIRVVVFGETVYVVVVEECHHLCRVFVKVVVAEGVVDAVEAAPYLIGILVLCISECREEGKVHRAVKFSLLHASDERCIRHPGLSDNMEVRVSCV